MRDRNSSLEVKVGIFVLIGIVLCGGLLVKFGKLGEGFKSYYDLTVEFPNASGLKANALILMAGAKIGHVSEGPDILPDASGVSVGLRVYTGVPIRSDSRIVIGSSGLLGDHFVDVIPGKDATAEILKAGETITGTRESGMSELTSQGTELIADLRAAVKKLDALIARTNSDLLTDKMFGDLHASIGKLRETMEKLSSSADKIDGVVDEAKSTLATAKGTISGLDGTISTTKLAAEDLRKAIGDSRTAIRQVNTLLDKAANGDGPVATLLNDAEFSADLKALIDNLRRSGILFYRDRPSGPAVEETATKRPAPGTGPRH